MKRPLYVRIGYEFNGQWNNYSESSYPQAFNRVAKVLRETNMVATVWCVGGSLEPVRCAKDHTAVAATHIVRAGTTRPMPKVAA